MTLTAEQHAIRRTALGASEIAAVLGDEESFQSAWDVWASKMPDDHPAYQFWQKRATNKAMHRGNWLESALAQRWASDHGLQLDHVPMATLRHPQFPWLVATPDAAAYLPTAGKRIGEMKTTRKPIDEAVCPERFEAQARGQLAVVFPLMDISRCDVVAWYMSADLPYYYPIERDQKAEKDLLAILEHWWRKHVVEGVEPDPSGSSMYDSFLNSQPSSGKRLSVDRQHPVHKLACDLFEVKREIKSLEEREADLSIRLKQSILDYDCVEGEFGKLWFSFRKGRTKTQWENAMRLLATKYKIPENEFNHIVASYTETGESFRALVPKWNTL